MPAESNEVEIVPVSECDLSDMHETILILSYGASAKVLNFSIEGDHAGEAVEPTDTWPPIS